jgi:hypothetical protein
MRTDPKHESVIAQMKGERKASNVVSQSKAVGVFTSFLDANIAFGVSAHPPQVTSLNLGTPAFTLNQRRFAFTT